MGKDSVTIISEDVKRAINREVNGLNYVLNTHDASGNSIPVILFSPDAKPIIEVWDYLEHIQTRITNKYNTLTRTCYDLCHFYDYLRIMRYKIEKLDDIKMGNFVDYLLMLDPDRNRRPKEAIERCFMRKVNILPFYDNKNNKKSVVAIRDGIGLQPGSITRIMRTVLRFLEWLKFKSPYRVRFEALDLDSLSGMSQNAKNRAQCQHGHITEAWQGYLKSRGVPLPNREIQPVDKDKVFTDAEIDQFTSRVTNPRDKFLFYILKIKGSRINEALKLRWTKPPCRVIGKGPVRWNYSKIEGDIKYSEGQWSIFIDQEKTNKTFWVSIPKYQQQEFERLLDRYLSWRRKQITGKDLGWVFIKQGGNGARLEYNAIRSQFDRIKIRAGLSYRKKLTIHSHRHYKVTNDLNQGVPLAIVVQDTGHNESTATQFYRHSSPDKQNEYSKGVEEYLGVEEQED